MKSTLKEFYGAFGTHFPEAPRTLYAQKSLNDIFIADRILPCDQFIGFIMFQSWNGRSKSPAMKPRRRVTQSRTEPSPDVTARDHRSKHA